MSLLLKQFQTKSLQLLGRARAAIQRISRKAASGAKLALGLVLTCGGWCWKKAGSFIGTIWLWVKTVSHFWVYIALGLVAALHVRQLIQVDVYALILIVLAVLPWLLELLSRHFDAFEAYGFKMNFARYGKVTVPPNLGEVVAANESQQTQGEDPAIDLKAVLSPVPEPVNEGPMTGLRLAKLQAMATLWHFQKSFYGEHGATRWGFSPAVKERKIAAALESLYNTEEVAKAPNGIYYLTDKGMEIARHMDGLLTAMGPHITEFASAPNA